MRTVVSWKIFPMEPNLNTNSQGFISEPPYLCCEAIDFSGFAPLYFVGLRAYDVRAKLPWPLGWLLVPRGSAVPGVLSIRFPPIVSWRTQSTKVAFAGCTAEIRSEMTPPPWSKTKGLFKCSWLFSFELGASQVIWFQLNAEFCEYPL